MSHYSLGPNSVYKYYSSKIIINEDWEAGR